MDSLIKIVSLKVPPLPLNICSGSAPGFIAFLCCEIIKALIKGVYRKTIQEGGGCRRTSVGVKYL